MNFLYGRLYEKYFPIKDISTFCKMEEKEFATLTRWIKNIEKDVSLQNDRVIYRAKEIGATRYKRIEFTYLKPINDLYLLLKNRQFSDLDKDDLEFVNDVLYRHKYNALISDFFVLFPTRNTVYGEGEK